jgi:NAD(P)-dependent dehydrogenase (short-subunit alcohol dehydrogenase family)
MAEKEVPLALVTGAAHRLGLAFADLLARRGYAILLHFRSSAGQASAAAQKLQAAGVPVYPIQADLGDPEQIRALFARLDGLPHPLKVLVNSAAVMTRRTVRELSVPEWDATLDINLRAPFLMAQAAAERMPAGGLIVNVSDAGANRAWTAFPAYAVSKAGLEALTRLLARAYAPKLRVNAIAPGLVLPSELVTPEEWQKLLDRLPLKHPAGLEEVAGALDFLLQNESLTGQTIVVDGGYSLL